MQPFDKSILIENIKSLIATRGTNQTKLADDINIGQPTMNKYLRGKQNIPVEHLYRIAQYFDVTLDSMFVKTVDESETPHPRPSVLRRDHLKESLQALATIFKYSALRTTEINFQETVYAEATDEYGRETGTYYRVQTNGPIGPEDPTNKYTGIFYSNYLEIASEFDSQDEADDYFTDLRDTGNLNSYNVKINSFIKKLSALHKVYCEDSMDVEAYHLAIDNNLTEALQQIE